LRELAPTELPPGGARKSAWPRIGRGRRDSTVLVVGGAGYIGSIVSANLLDAGYDVIVLDALLYGHASLESLEGRPGFQLIAGDTRETALVQRLLPHVGSVIHLGEIVGDPACDLDPVVSWSVNHHATARLAAMAASSGVTRFVYPSSCSVYGATDQIAVEDGPLNPVSLYGHLKRESEKAVLSHASARFHPTVFRLATAYGLSPRPRFDLVVNILAGRGAAEGSIVIQGGGQWRPFVHVADVAGLLARSIEHRVDEISGEIFNLGSNTQNHTVGDVAEMVRAELPSVRILVSDTVDRRNYRVSFDKVEGILAFQPKRTVADGVAEIVRAVGNGHVDNIRMPGYSNVRALVETSARLRLWRSDLGDGDPANAFRPKDADRRTFEEPVTYPEAEEQDDRRDDDVTEAARA
jgi:nucleoside-diphosphate-sugar epimerase